MARNLYATVSEHTPDNLIADNHVYQKRIEVSLNEAGEYHRGQLLNIAADNQAVMVTPIPVDPGEDGEGGEALLSASADTTTGVLLTEVGEIGAGEDVRAAAAVTGEFNANAVLWAEVAESDRQAVIATARKHQLYIEPMRKVQYLQYGEV